MSVAADEIRAEVQQAQDELHDAVAALLTQPREQTVLAVLVRWLLARVTR